MARGPMLGNGVFCLEGEWNRNLTSRASVLPTLEHLERLGEIKFIHKDVATREEMRYYFQRLDARRYNRYLVVYLAMHGDPGCLWVNSRDKQPLDLMELADLMGTSCSERDVYFGSCQTVSAPPTELAEFKRRTGVRRMCGYTRPVEWVEASAFEILLLSAMVRARYQDGAERHLQSEPFRSFTKKLGLVFI